MVVLLPLLDGESVLVCYACGSLGLRSTVRERSNFYARSAKCKECRKAATRDPERRRRQNEKRRRRMAGLKSDPEAWEAYQERVARPGRRRYLERHPERRRESDRQYARTHRAQRRAATRRYRERHPEEVRMIQIGTREKRGQRLKPLSEVRKKQVTTGAVLPIEPFRDWVNQLVAAQERAARYDREEKPAAVAKRRVADMLGVTVRRLYAYRFEMTEVHESVVDHACSAHGGVHILDVYPDLYDRAEAAA